MPIFHFHVRRGNTIYEDREGSEIETVGEAVRCAVEDARAVIRDEPEVPRASQWIEVVDQLGNTVRTVPFETVSL